MKHQHSVEVDAGRPARARNAGSKPGTVLAFLALAFLLAAPGLPAASKRLLGYYFSGGRHRTPPYNADVIPYHELTHIVHSFIEPDAKNDGSIDVRPDFLDPTLISKAHAADVKVMVSVGGWGAPQTASFRAIVADQTARSNLAKSLAGFVMKNGYDGVDIDWEYPEGPADRASFTFLMRALRKELPSPRYLLSLATVYDPRRYQDGYDFGALSKICDFFNVMTYDVHNSLTNHAGHNSPLFLSPADPGQEGSVATDIDVYENYYHVPAAELNMGTAFFGIEFTSVNKLWEHCGCAGVAFGRPYLSYILPRINHLGWRRHFDRRAGEPYLVRADASQPGLISYDDPASTARKVDYALGKRDVGGVFMWALGQDYDGHSQQLLDAMYHAFAKYAGPAVASSR